MAVANEIPVDAARRRRRRVALVLALGSALLGSAFVADSLLNGKGEETAWTTDTAFPRFTGGAVKPRGVTVPISKRVIHAGQGGPEEPGPYIEEARDGWLLADGQAPIDAFARTGFSLPRHMPVSGNGFGFGQGGGFGGGGGGGGDGGVIFSCPEDSAGLEKLTGKPCAASETVPTETGDVPGNGGLTILPAVTAPVPGGGPSVQPSGPGGTPPGENGSGPSQVTPVSVVPEPQNWAMMIAGFFLAGMAIRNGRTQRTRRAVAIVR